MRAQLFRLSVLLAAAYTFGTALYLDVVAAAMGGETYLDILTLGWIGAYAEIGVYAYATVGGLYLIAEPLRVRPVPRPDPEKWLYLTIYSLLAAAACLFASIPLFWFVSQRTGGVVLGFSDIAVVAAFAFLAVWVLSELLARWEARPSASRISALEVRVERLTAVVQKHLRRPPPEPVDVAQALEELEREAGR